MKFVEKCFVLDDDVIGLRNKELCAAITYQSVEKHLFQGHIHFSFLIKKNCKESLKTGASVENVKNDCTKPKAAAYSMPNKGSLKGNNVRKGPSVPDVKATGGGVLKKEIVVVEIEENKAGKSQPPDYSSINKINNNNHLHSPAHCTEALKRNDDELVGTNLSCILECRKKLVSFYCSYSQVQQKQTDFIIFQILCVKVIKPPTTKCTVKNIQRRVLASRF